MWLWVGDKPSGGEDGRLEGSNELCLTFFFSLLQSFEFVVVKDTANYK
jgi:hypothetical protein